jgi:ABC-2 type transport system ATP-binding protein
MSVAETQDRFKQRENGRSASGSNLESGNGSAVVLRNGPPATQNPVGRAASRAVVTAIAVEAPNLTKAMGDLLVVDNLNKRPGNGRSASGSNLESGNGSAVVLRNGPPATQNPVGRAASRAVVTAIAVETQNLTKAMGDLLVVDNLNLEIRRNEVLGLLGPNGAGKTTAIKMMVGLLNPTSGRVLFDGVEADSVDKRRIGVCPQDLVHWDSLTCRENLIFMGDMYGIPAPQLRARVNQLLHRLYLTEKADQAAAKLSGGVKRRLNIALSLVHDPEILFLDEPSAGLDPQARILLWEFIRSLRDEEGKTIVLTTHDMEEADALSDRIAILDHGKLLRLDTPDGLKNTLGKGDTIELHLLDPAMSQEMLMQIRSMDGIEGAQKLNGKIAVSALGAASKLPKIVHLIERAGGDIADISVRRDSLEDVFVSLTGRALRE